ncbi:lysophospholipid acyltransferase family protein [Teredinibacter sp. KSP-S5-2]|uniref:lysophospholipid acyltransferase family protein n=1 Tax=Teredinibacter sp. KSP-S5-2 TaxID=3034506 RepID=UPI002934D857|nr:lysophospholipid acyltransferase family protein [Teredinibacter sp. KSP-S5-2]WNO09157.1 lysophospholipid acyltransferase family protein [Teredinibacter sp. KSP-S5-2]
MKTIKSRLVLILLKSLGLLPLSVARAIGSLVGRIMWLSQDRNCKVTLRNLELCYPDMSEEERVKMAKVSLRESSKVFFESLVVYRRSPQWLESKIVAVYGQELIEKALSEDKGLIFLGPHLGNWEVIGQKVSQLGQLTALYMPPKHTYLEEFVLDAREKQGGIFLPATIKGVAGLVKALKKKEIVGILPDQVPDMGWVFAPFFGVRAGTMTLVHGLLSKVPCNVISCVAIRCKAGFEIHYVAVPEEIYSDDQQTSVAALNQAVERCVQLKPEQYQWEYKRFKARKDFNEPCLYWD